VTGWQIRAGRGKLGETGWDMMRVNFRLREPCEGSRVWLGVCSRAPVCQTRGHLCSEHFGEWHAAGTVRYHRTTVGRNGEILAGETQTTQPTRSHMR